jgi:hypothetical protein
LEQLIRSQVYIIYIRELQQNKKNDNAKKFKRKVKAKILRICLYFVIVTKDFLPKNSEEISTS